LCRLSGVTITVLSTSAGLLAKRSFEGAAILHMNSISSGVRECVENLSLSKRNFPMATGTVKWFDATKGYGFIQPDQGGKDVFVHISAVEQAGLRGLNEGQKVNFEIIADKRTGKQAAGNLTVAG
jgi:CspA family cold shock protein